VGVIQTASRYVPDRGVHRFPVLIPVRRGERLGVDLGPGASIGVRASPGNLARRFTLALGPEGLLPGQSAGASSQAISGQMLVQAAYVRGADGAPPQVDGRAAALVSAGTPAAQAVATLPQGEVIAAVVRVHGQVALDLYLNHRRYARAQLPQLDPRGKLDRLTANAFNAAAGFDDVTIAWTNPGGHTVATTLRITARGILAMS
jgi:hypothetical protein